MGRRYNIPRLAAAMTAVMIGVIVIVTLSVIFPEFGATLERLLRSIFQGARSTPAL